jgi:hypothetical protein
MQVFRRFYALYFIAFISFITAISTIAVAQIPDRNVNMVSGTSFPDGDPYLQRQNEPSIAVSTRNPLHLMAGANDYRTVDIPGLPDGRIIGDAWLGLFKSFDGGSTWRSTLLPGYPQDNSPEGLASPLKGFEAGADPTMRAGTNGLFYYSGIVLNRGDNGLGKLFVARFIDNNNVEGGDSIQYLNTAVIDTGTAGQFIDKPWMAVDVPRQGASQCQIGTQSFPAGNVYVSYSSFTGSETNNPHTKLFLARSTDCGTTWSKTKISESFSVSQGSTVAIDPNTGAVYVAWRQFQTSALANSIIVTKSVDGGRTFSRGEQVAAINPFEQSTTAYSFRTNAYPTMAIDANGRVYIAWAERGRGAGGDARIVVSNSTNGDNWSAPAVVDPTNARGHQLMPALTFAEGKLMLVYYDLREDHTLGIFAQFDNFFYNEISRLKLGDLLDEQNGEAKVFTAFVSDDATLRRRHTIDVRVAQAVYNPNNAGAPLAFGAGKKVSQYAIGSKPDSDVIEQLQVNPPNLPMFKKGTVPFFGDYIDIAGSSFSQKADGSWKFNVALSKTAVFHTAWTDNRDVRRPPGDDWTKYTPPGSQARQSVFDPTQTVEPCNPSLPFSASRNQNIYTARITDGLLVGALNNSKPLGSILVNGVSTLIQRPFSFFVQNATLQTKSFRLTISGPQPSGQASFERINGQALLQQVDVTVAPRSTIARTVFAISSDRRARITINAAEISAPNGVLVAGGLQGSVILNSDSSNPDPSDPNLANNEIYNPDVFNTPEIFNQDIANPDIANAPEIGNPDIANPDIANQDIANPDIANPDIANPDIANPDIANPDIANGAITDTTWQVSNVGNAAASYSVKLLLNGNLPSSVKLQLIIHQTYENPVAQGCVLATQQQNVILSSIPNPVFVNPADIGIINNLDAAIKNATVSLKPGEEAKVTLRVFDPNKFDDLTFDPATAVTPVLVAQGARPGDPNNYISLTILSTVNSLPSGFKGTSYSTMLQATGGKGPYQWSIIEGSSTLSSFGLSLNSSTGEISGAPTRSGKAAFKVAVKDLGTPGDDLATQTLVIKILNRAPTVNLTIGNSQDFKEGGQPLNLSANASDPDGDALSYVWELVSGPGTLTPNAAPNEDTAKYSKNDGPAQVTIKVTVQDPSGVAASSTQTFSVLNAPPVITNITAPLDSVLLGTTINVGGNFTDLGTLDTHTAVWDWGDGTTSTGNVTEQSGSGSVAGAHLYAAAGVYTLKLTVTDKDNGSVQSTFEYIVINEAASSNESAMNGGGWALSPAGAYPSNSSLTGRANFGFVAKGRRNVVPTGQTQFHFNALTFHSTSYTSLSVTGSQAQLKGTGTINNAGSYNFILTVIDGGNGGAADKFRMKIWGTSGIIYDNQMNAADGANPTQTISGGNITVR